MHSTKRSTEFDQTLYLLRESLAPRLEKQRLATLKRLKQCNDNELEKKLRLEKVVASKQLRLAMETDEERKARLEKMVATTQITLTLETEEERRAKKKGMDLIDLDLIALRLEF